MQSTGSAVLFPQVTQEVRVVPESRQDVLLLKKIGHALKKRRLELDLSIRQLSHNSGINREYISELEHGKRSLTVFMLLRLSEALAIECGELLELADL